MERNVTTTLQGYSLTVPLTEQEYCQHGRAETERILLENERRRQEANDAQKLRHDECLYPGDAEADEAANAKPRRSTGKSLAMWIMLIFAAGVIVGLLAVDLFKP